MLERTALFCFVAVMCLFAYPARADQLLPNTSPTASTSVRAPASTKTATVKKKRAKRLKGLVILARCRSQTRSICRPIALQIQRR
jgi:hypothetical protein